MIETSGGIWAFLAAAVSAAVSFAVARRTARPAELTLEQDVEARLWLRVREELDRYAAEVASLRRQLEECLRGRAQVEQELGALRLSVLRLSERMDGDERDARP